MHTTTRKARQQLCRADDLPYELLKNVLRVTAEAQTRFGSVKCPVLFVHSVDDDIASYARVAATVRSNAHVDSFLVTLFGLQHFLQFDVSSGALRNLALHFFDIQKNDPAGAHQGETPFLVEQLKQRSEESRHWSDILFRLLVGFYTVLGGLLYFTLSDVLLNGEKAPYYLVSYSLIISLFVNLSALYFFYLNRVDAYIKFHLEPYISGVGWTSFRTNRWASGRASRVMTRVIVVAELLLPFLISGFVVVFTFVKYRDRLLTFSSGNSFLQASLTLSAILWIVTAYNVSLVRKYGAERLYGPVVPVVTRERVEEYLDRLYSSIEPGSVRQPSLDSILSGDKTRL